LTKALIGPTGIIDPPWAYQKSSKNEKLRGYSTDHEYPALSTENMVDLPIAKMMTYGFLWTTGPFIEDAYKLIRGWGMEPVTTIYWVKTSEIYTDNSPVFPITEEDAEHLVFKPTYGIGYWFRGCVEPIILFRAPGAPSIRTNEVGLLSPNGKHSRKPNSLHKLIEDFFPGPYVELFGRRSRPGWTVLGNQAPGDGADIRVSIQRHIDQQVGG
jgi:N6-adenosine-specific RNA methylase IME4